MASAAGRADDQPAPSALPSDVAQLPVPNHLLLVLGVMIASLMQVLDMTIANVAIPHMQSALGATPDTISWVLTSYIIASAVAMPITGWLADRVGSRRLFLISVTLFVLASMLCGVAQNLEEMVIFRALQGVGGAFIAPLSQSAMLDSTRPSKQPQMLALWGMGVIIGPIIGPSLGGYLTEYLSWRWVFYVNVPFGIVCLAILLAQLPSRPLVRRRFDLFGFAAIAIALASLQLLLDRGSVIDWFSSVEGWIYGGLAISCAWMAVVHHWTAPDPLFNKGLFANGNFLIALLFLMLVGMTMFATTALMPPMLQRLFGYDVIDTGWVLMPRGVGVLISMRISAQLMQRGVDPRWMVGSGFLIVGWSMLLMSGWSLEADSFHFISTAFLQGLGIGLVFLSLNASAFATLPPHLRTDGATMLNLARTVGSSIGISIVSTLAAHNTQLNHAELAEHITPELSSAIDLSSIDRFQQYGEAGLAMVDGMVTQQAAMIAYINDFYLMGWMCVLTAPLVLLMRRAKRAG